MQNDLETVFVDVSELGDAVKNNVVKKMCL